MLRASRAIGIKLELIVMIFGRAPAGKQLQDDYEKGNDCDPV